MKILHVMPSLARSFGGPTQSLVGYASAAQLIGAKVDVIGPEVSSEDRLWLKDEMPEVTCRYFDSLGIGGISFTPGLIDWLWKSGDKYEIIHVHGLFNPISSLAHRICTVKKWPVVVRPFGTLSKYTFSHRKTWLKRRYFKWMDRPGLERAGGLHFTTEAEREEASWVGIDFSGRGHVIPPPLLDNRKISSAGRQDKGKQVLFLSRLHPKKNLEALLNAWPLVLKNIPGARLIIAGTGESEYVRSLKRLSYQLGCSHIVFAGFVEGEAKQALFDDSDVFVLPSFQENFGVAVLEALAVGLPVVITPEVQLADFVTTHKVGHVIEPTPENIATSISVLLQNRAFQSHCGHAGPALVQKHFSIKSVGHQLAGMYESVIEKNNAAIFRNN